MMGMRSFGGGWQRRAGLTALAVVVALAVGSTVARGRLVGAAHPTPQTPHTIAAGTVAAIGSTTALYVVTVDYGQGRTLYYVDPAHKIAEMVFTNSSGATEDAYAVRPGSGALADTRTVDYVRHTWRDRTTSGTEGAIENPTHGVAQELRQNVLSAGNSNGTGTLAGIDMIGGQRAYRVVLALPDGELTTIWIDTTTSLPVRSTSPGVTMTYRWNVPRGGVPASLWPAVPSGFREKGTATDP
jgi:hypothetical protein